MAPKRSEATLRLQRRIAELRRAQVSWDEISDEVGRTVRTCYEHYTNFLLEQPAETLQQARQRELQITEDALRRLLQVAHNESVTPRTQVEALNAIRGWSEHRAKMMGLNAPVRTQVSHISSELLDAEIKRLTNELNNQPGVIDGEIIAELPPADSDKTE